MRALLFLLFCGCGALDRDAPVPYASVVYDLRGGDIPLPNDVVREDGHLALPTDDVGPAEAAFREALNALDGWSTGMPITATLSEPADPDTLGAIRVWAWGAQPQEIAVDVEVHGTALTITAPSGWDRGGEVLVVVDTSLATRDGLPFGPDAAMFLLLQTGSLVDHPRAVPGDTREEREANAVRLEGVREGLAAKLDQLGDEGPTRDRIAAAWSFTTTRRVELAMDAGAQRMPLPFDLLIDPQTGLVELPPSPDDDPLVADARRVLSTYSGFALGADLTFDVTGPIDRDVADAVTLWDLGQAPVQVPATARAMSDDGACALDCTHVVVSVDQRPLRPATTYGVRVSTDLRDLDGDPVVPMPVGHLLRLTEPLVADGASAISSLSDADAARVEGVRSAIAPLLDREGRADTVTAWPFTTLDPRPGLRGDVRAATALGLDLTPRVVDDLPMYSLVADDALTDLLPGLVNPAVPVYLPRTIGVDRVIEGTIPSPYFLDPTTRRWGEPVVQDLPFIATIPDGIRAGDRVPVVIFGHPIVTDRRFLLTISGALAQAGFAAVAIDFPFHGERIACIDASLVAVPNFLPPSLQSVAGLTEPLLYLPPCVSGANATCGPLGQCLDASGRPEAFSAFPIIDVKPASGAAFLDVSDLPHVSDHFRQAIVDFGALHASLKGADWSEVLGADVGDVHYAGMSLGGILGAVFVAVSPDVDRAVLNVPGADLVHLFRDSTYFGPQMDATYEDLGVERGTFDEVRLTAIATWLIDAVDPYGVAGELRGRSVLVQQDRVNGSLGDMVIPGHATDTLVRVGELEVVEYTSVLHGDLVIPLLGDAMLRDLVDHLEGP